MGADEKSQPRHDVMVMQAHCRALLQVLRYCRLADDLSVLPRVIAGMEFVANRVTASDPRENDFGDPRTRELWSRIIGEYEIVTGDRGYRWRCAPRSPVQERFS
jgi:hypothetical protein